MGSYKDLHYVENKKRINELTTFQKDLKRYIKNSSYDGWVDGIIEEPAAEDARSKINKRLHRYIEIIQETGVSIWFVHTTAPLAGSRKSTLNIVSNLFNLNQYEIPQRTVLDTIEMALGIYETDQKQSLYRTFNPFYWLRRLFIKLASIPINIGIEIGIFDKKIKSGKFWQIWESGFKLLGWVVSLLASFLGILQILGKLDWFLNFFK